MFAQLYAALCYSKHVNLVQRQISLHTIMYDIYVTFSVHQNKLVPNTGSILVLGYAY